MKNVTPQERFQMLIDSKATCLGNFRNDLGQMMEFYEHPTLGDEANVLVMFPEFKVAYNSTFYDLEDMTATYHSIGMFMDEPDEDMDYVPYLFDVLDEGFTMKFKYELNTAMEYIVTTARRKKNAV